MVAALTGGALMKAGDRTQPMFHVPAVIAGEQAPYTPRPAACFRPRRIILARGSVDTPGRWALVERICAVYPSAEVIERLDVAHNRIDLGTTDPLKLHWLGKRTLVLGEHHSAVRQSTEEGNTCPNYWHFSPYGYCPYGCQYCYLAGTQGVRFSPTVKIFVNLEEILGGVDRVAGRLGRPTAFYLGKLQDGLALEPLTGFMRTIVPFFAAHPFARLTLLTKSADVRNLLDLDHRQHTILSWTVTPPEIAERFEPRTPRPADRVEAMKACAAAGYPIRAVVMPILPVPRWRTIYGCFLEELTTAVPLSRITLGGICIYDSARQVMERKLGTANLISDRLERAASGGGDGRRRFPIDDRVSIYRHLIGVIRRHRPDLPVGLCLEEHEVFEALGMTEAIGCCNCVL
jgi:spore photoproduct lyase